MAVKQGSSIQYFYLLRDYLGSITHVVDASYNVVAEYSYDACSVKTCLFVSSSETKSLVEQIPISEAVREGRRRDKDTWKYTLNNEPDLFAGRGFTAHEFLPYFNLYNMNGRLYDPLVGRFLSPDNYVQLPDFTQNFNRYSYALNNPLKYTDPDGEFIFSLLAVITGQWWALPITIGADIGMWSGGSAVNGTMNPFKWDYSDGKTWSGMGVGALAGGIGGGIGTGAIGGLSGLEAVMAGGMTAGAINGAGMTAIAGGSFSDVIGEMIKGAVVGGFSAAAGYGAFQGADQLLTRLNPFKGIGGAMLFGNFPLHNTICYMASSTASQMTSNLMTGQGMFDNLDYGINLGIILPLYADIGSRFSSIRTRLVKEQYISEDGSNVTEAWPWARRTEIQDNGDLVVHTMFETEKLVHDTH